MRLSFIAAGIAAGIVVVLAAATGPTLSAAPAAAQEVKLYKNPQCGCCEGYAEYLRENGFAVTVEPTHELAMMNREAGLSDEMAGCHLSFVGDYVVSGHVPVGTLERLLDEKPAIEGITLPGMPMGSPGMGGAKQAPFTIYEIGESGKIGGGEPGVYAVE